MSLKARRPPSLVFSDQGVSCAARRGWFVVSLRTVTYGDAGTGDRT